MGGKKKSMHYKYFMLHRREVVHPLTQTLTAPPNKLTEHLCHFLNIQLLRTDSTLLSKYALHITVKLCN